MLEPARGDHRRGQLRRAGGAVYQHATPTGSPMLGARAGAASVDVALPGRAARDVRERRRAHADPGAWRPRATATWRRLRVRGPDGEETLQADACFVFIGASPHTDWLSDVVARDERGFILAGPDVPENGWPLGRDPYVLLDQRPRRVRGRRRARPLGQARGQRWGRARWPSRSSTSTSPTREPAGPSPAADLRPVDLFDDLSDAELEPWAAVAHLRKARPRRIPGPRPTRSRPA